MSKADPLQEIPLFSHLTARERCKIGGEVVEARYGKGQFKRARLVRGTAKRLVIQDQDRLERLAQTPCLPPSK